MSSVLKTMYKQIPKTLLRNKWDMEFVISPSVFYKEKSNIHNGRFLGINVRVHGKAPQSLAYLL